MNKLFIGKDIVCRNAIIGYFDIIRDDWNPNYPAVSIGFEFEENKSVTWILPNKPLVHKALLDICKVNALSQVVGKPIRLYTIPNKKFVGLAHFTNDDINIDHEMIWHENKESNFWSPVGR